MTDHEIAFAVVNLIATGFAAYAALRSATAAEKSLEVADKSVKVAVAAEQAAEKGAEAARLQADAARDQVEVSRTQTLVARRQFISELWDRLCNLREIDPKDPAPMYVHNALTTMELVGLCCEGGMIDADVIKRTFSERYIELYDQVNACGKIPNMGDKTGPQLLQQNPAAMSFYKELVNDKLGHKKLSV